MANARATSRAGARNDPMIHSTILFYTARSAPGRVERLPHPMGFRIKYGKSVTSAAGQSGEEASDKGLKC